MDAKRISQSAINTLMMVAFAVPGGQGFGAFLAITDFLVGFFPDASNPPAPLTDTELEDALAAIKADIVASLWDNDIDDDQFGVLALNTQFQAIWGSMHDLHYDKQTRSVLPSPIDGFIPATDAYFNTEAQDAIWVRLQSYLNKLESDARIDPKITAAQALEHKTRTTGLYALIGSLMAAYFKAAVAWQWGFTLAKNLRLEKYNEEVDDWNSQDGAYQLANPFSVITTKYKDLFDEHGALYVNITWEAYAAVPIGPVALLKKQVQSMIDYCAGVPAQNGKPAKPGLYTTMMQNWDAADAWAAAFDFPLPPNKGISVVQMEAGFGMAIGRATQWESLMNNYGFRGVIEQDLTDFGIAIDALRTVLASVSFRNYTVTKSDTLASIAQHFYHDPALASKIIDTNRDQCPDASKFTLGMILKIYDPGALPYAPLPTPAS